ncbi:MAG: nucleotidyltransferase domain-containing protein [Desulfovermiculus sp.]
MSFGLDKRTLEMLRSVFARYDQVDEVIIYGSRAKGNYGPGSDIDLVVKGRNLSLSLLHNINQEIDDLLLPYTVDISLFAHITHPNLLDHIQRVGQQFYKKAQSV